MREQTYNSINCWCGRAEMREICSMAIVPDGGCSRQLERGRLITSIKNSVDGQFNEVASTAKTWGLDHESATC